MPEWAKLNSYGLVSNNSYGALAIQLLHLMGMLRKNIMHLIVTARNYMIQRLAMAGFSWVVIVVSVGCGMASGYAESVIQDAKAQLLAAQATDAQNLATETYGIAAQMLTEAESALHNGNTEEAYRLGRRAYLTGKLAESISIAQTIEEKARNMEKRLELNIQATEKAKRELEQANMELERFTTTPEN